MARAGKSNTLKEAPVLKTLSPRQDHKQVRALVFTHHKSYRKAAALAQYSFHLRRMQPCRNMELSLTDR